MKNQSSTHWIGNFRAHQIDTTPGERGPFSPPTDWQGTEDDYLELMRERYRSCPATRQQMVTAGRRIALVEFSGPMAGVAAKIAKKSVERP